MKLETKSSGGVTVVSVIGNRVTGDAAARLRESLVALAQQGHKRVVLDLGEVDFLDSGGLGSVVAAFRHFQPDGGLVVACPNPRVQSLFQLTRVDKVLPVLPDLESAVKVLEG